MGKDYYLQYKFDKLIEEYGYFIPIESTSNNEEMMTPEDLKRLQSLSEYLKKKGES